MEPHSAFLLGLLFIIQIKQFEKVKAGGELRDISWTTDWLHLRCLSCLQVTVFGDVTVINNKQHLFHSLNYLSNFWNKHPLGGNGFSTRHKWVLPESTSAARAPQEPEEIFQLHFWSPGSKWHRDMGVTVVSVKSISKWKSASKHTGPFSTLRQTLLVDSPDTGPDCRPRHQGILQWKVTQQQEEKKTVSESRYCSRKHSKKGHFCQRKAWKWDTVVAQLTEHKLMRIPFCFVTRSRKGFKGPKIPDKPITALLLPAHYGWNQTSFQIESTESKFCLIIKYRQMVQSRFVNHWTRRNFIKLHPVQSTFLALCWSSALRWNCRGQTSRKPEPSHSPLRFTSCCILAP